MKLGEVSIRPPSKEEVERMLRHVSLVPQFHVYEFNTMYSIVDEDRPDSSMPSKDQKVIGNRG